MTRMNDFNGMAQDPEHRRAFENLLDLACQRGDADLVAVQALLKAGADPNHLDGTGLTALDYARRKLARLQAKPRRRRKSPSLDENNQLLMSPDEQAHLDKMREELGPEDGREFARSYLKECMRAARRVFNDPMEVERIVDLLEAAAGTGV